MKRARRLSPAVVAYIGMQVAAGLHAAHEVTDDDGQPLHVVHRDVSPKNILLAYKGYVKLIDFGIAKVRDATQSTTAGSLKGTIRYMSPEQAAGLNVDRRSDVFSLGIVLWEMVTGRPLFQAENELAALDMVRSANVPPPSHFASVPPALEQTIMRMLRPSAADRFATTDEVQRALAAAVPEALAFSPQKLGELVAALIPAPSDGELDPLIVSALGRPLPLEDTEEVLSRLLIPLDQPSGDAQELSSGVSGAVPRGWSQGPSLTPVPMSQPGWSRPSLEVGPLSSAGQVQAVTGTGIAEGRAKVPVWAWAAPLALMVLAGIAAGVAWTLAEQGPAPNVAATAPSPATPTAPSPATPTAPSPATPTAPSPPAPATAEALAAPASAPASPTTDPTSPPSEAQTSAPASARPAVRGRRGARGPREASEPSTTGATASTGAAQPPAGRGDTSLPRRRGTHVTDQPLISNQF
jgi:serine/threonine-protein kinase